MIRLPTRTKRMTHSFPTRRSSQTGDAAEIVDAAANEIDLDRLMQDMPQIEDLLETRDDAPIIRMINALFTQAARDGASDIHIEPFEPHSVVRSEEHTSELQSLMRTSYAVFCLQKKQQHG